MIRVGLFPVCPHCGLKPVVRMRPKDGDGFRCVRCGGEYAVREIWMGIVACAPVGQLVPCRSCGNEMPADRCAIRDAPGLCWRCAHDDQGEGKQGALVPAPPPPPPPHKGPCKCCARALEYNGYGSDGPTLFTCPQHCPCHD